MIGQHFLGQRIEFPGADVFLDLPIPRVRIEINEPSAKLGQLVGRQPGYGVFQIVKRHGWVPCLFNFPLSCEPRQAPINFYRYSPDFTGFIRAPM